MTRREIAKKYITRLQDGDIQGVLRLFAEGSEVISPIYGRKDALDFYQDLANDTQQSDLSLLSILEDDDTGLVAIYFMYKWTLSSGQVVDFEVVDLLQFDSDDKITELKIIYDTVETRTHFS